MDRGTADQPVSPATDSKDLQVAAMPVLRLTGEQIDSITPPPDGDWFTDWDEYEEFVPLRMLAAAAEREQAATTVLRDVLEGIAALCPFIPLEGPFPDGVSPWGVIHAVGERARAALASPDAATPAEPGELNRPLSEYGLDYADFRDPRSAYAKRQSRINRGGFRPDDSTFGEPATPAEPSSTLDVERRVREMIEAGTLPKNACPGCGCTPDRRWTETWINSSNHDKVIRAGSCHVHGHQCSEYARLSTRPASSETPGEAQGK